MQKSRRSHDRKRPRDSGQVKGRSRVLRDPARLAALRSRLPADLEDLDEAELAALSLRLQSEVKGR